MTTRALSLFLCLILLLAACSTPAPASPATEVVSSSEPPVVNAPPTAEPLPVGYYDPGSPTVTDLWVDPLNGSDSADGLSAASALQTLDAAWRKIPMGQALSSTGYRIRLQAGGYPAETMPNYWESRYGSYEAPIIIQGEGSEAGQVILQGNVNVFDSRYLYFDNLSIITPGDAFHCEQCEHLLIRNVIMYSEAARELIKINQSQYIFIENSDLGGAEENTIDFVAVQYGHILHSYIHDAGDWCAYVKGGSAYLRVEGNEIYNCGTGGFTAGQGTGFQFMTPPWLTYEAYDIRVVNNIIHDTEGAGLGVNGGYNILLAYNTLYRVGSRSHGIEVVFGMRSCDGQSGDEGRERCQQYLDAGGWGTTEVDTGENHVHIPNKNIFIYNNILYNPPGFRSEDQHFAIYGPRQNPASSGIPLAVTDANLQIKGNILWNGDSSMPLGIEESSEGCQPANPTCNMEQLRAENAVNTLEPVFTDPSSTNFTPLGSWWSEYIGYTIPDFVWDLVGIPAGQASNAVTGDQAGNERSDPGAGALMP